ncbi:MAG: PrsW family glutamic-type intramembrane protease [Verrucomicrobiales bacterium]
MRLNKPRLYRWSRDKSVIIKASLAILAAGVVTGFFISSMTFGSSFLASNDKLFLDDGFLRTLGAEGDVDVLAKLVRESDLIKLRFGSPLEEFHQQEFGEGEGSDSKSGDADGEEAVDPSMPDQDFEWIGKTIDLSPVSSAEKDLLHLLNQGLHGSESDSLAALAALGKQSGATPPVRHAATFYGDVLREHTRIDEAIAAYRSEVDQFPTGTYEPDQIVRLRLARDDPEDLARLLTDDSLLRRLSSGMLAHLASKGRDLSLLVRAVVAHDFEGIDLSLAFLTLFAGTLWAFILAQFAKFEQKRLALFALATMLGIISASVTLGVVIIQDDWMGFGGRRHGELLDQMIFWVCGVGLREELVKLLLFTPLLPFLRQRGPLEALLAASFVGLGFAVQENLGYFDMTFSSGTPWARLLTANFFHLALTGLLGLALYDFVKRPRRWEPLLETFLLVVVAHGFYDLVISTPVLGYYGGWIHILILAFIATRYFRTLDQLYRIVPGQPISPLGVFVVGSSLLLAVMFSFACQGALFATTLSTFGLSTTGLVVVAFLYINEFKHL